MHHMQLFTKREENRYYEIMLELKIGKNGARLFKFNIKIGRADGNYTGHYQVAKQKHIVTLFKAN